NIGKNAFYVNTGHVLPENANAVIMIEHVQIIGENQVQIEAPVFPWQHVRKMGEDIVATELLFPRNHRITPYSIGALLSGGIFSVQVRKKPKVLIIPTGSELVDWRKAPIEVLKPGQVLETNSVVLGKLVEAWGGQFERHEMVRDDLESLTQIVRQACLGDADIILTVGGSSAGSEDYSSAIIQNIGKVLVHGITMMPGKPLIMGVVNQKPVFGIPGYPVSAIVAFEQIVGPLITTMIGQPELQRPTVSVEPIRKIPSKLGIEEFLRVKLGKVDDRIVAIALPRGAGCITTLTQADGIIRIPNHLEGIKENEPVQAELLRPLSSIKNTIVVVGSHDNTLDVLADMISFHYPGLTLSSSHVGSMGGLMAIKRGVCHLAGSHLLNTEDGTYNLSDIRRFLPDIPVKRVQLVFRDQGFMVSRGNPKGIKGIEDLVRKDIRFVNRQSGSGTRILLDYRIRQLNLNPEDISGYDVDEFTHMSVAAAVLGGTADMGLGIYAAARALNLDFIPVVTEQYDLIIPERFFDTDNIQHLLTMIRTPDFKQRVEKLGGYHTERTGEILGENPASSSSGTKAFLRRSV
ncbi:MAG: molybdopterin biosynthesis protein, partial [Desulfatirhabdiaceae bacterium]|nr:molybdopterin biosynthesis protein [Desulfatirhabdiaceae bacterium]